MSDHNDVRVLPLGDVAHHCAQETQRFFRQRAYDPRYCFELFRRAIALRSDRAWECVYTQYRAQVAGWIRHHPAFPDSGEQVDYLINRAFEKMWSALPPARFERFANLKSLLRYLQMCVHSVILDHVRSAERSTHAPIEHLPPQDFSDYTNVEEQALERVHGQALWQEINARLRTEKEQRVVYGSFVLGLKPRQLHAQYPDTFANMTEIYRIKQNVLARLRRDDELIRLLQSA